MLTIETLWRRSGLSLLLTLNTFHFSYSVSIVDFDQLIAG